MKFLLTLHAAEDAAPAMDTPEMAAEMQAWFDYSEALAKAGALLGGEALQPAATATTVRVRDDSVVTTDGPHVETKEVLGGFYLIEVADRAAAIEWAAKIPNVTYGTVEVWPVMSFD